MRSFSALPVAFAVLALSGPATGAGSVDAGRTWFERVCNTCHFEPPTAPRFVPGRFSPEYLTSAFQRTFAMNGNLTLLGNQGINDVATYLGLVGLGLPDSSDTDRLLDWGEETYSQLLTPARQPTQQFSGYTFRFYSTTGVYVGTKDLSVWFFDSRTPGAEILNLGTLRNYLNQMPNGR